MNEPADGFFKIRPAFVMWFLAALGWLVIIAGFVLWWGLPRWEPALVVANSPWFGPAFESVTYGAHRQGLADRLPEWGAQVVLTLCDTATSDAEEERRKTALFLLGHCVKDLRVVPLILPLLHDPDLGICESAITAIRTHHDSSFTQSLLDALPGLAPDPARRIAKLLATLPEEVPYDLVVMHLLTATRTDLQQYGCVVMGGSKDPRAITALVERLGKIREGQVDYAGYALGQLPQPSAVEAIITALQDPEPLRRHGAIWGVRGRVASKGQNHAQLRDPLLHVANDQDPAIRSEALRALWIFHDESVIPVLRTAVTDRGKPAFAAAHSLGRLHTAGAITVMVANLHHPEVEVRRLLVRHLSNQTFTDRVHNEAIVALLADPDEDVVKRTRNLLQKLDLAPEQRAAADAHVPKP